MTTIFWTLVINSSISNLDYESWDMIWPLFYHIWKNIKAKNGHFGYGHIIAQWPWKQVKITGFQPRPWSWKNTPLVKIWGKYVKFKGSYCGVKVCEVQTDGRTDIWTVILPCWGVGGQIVPPPGWCGTTTPHPLYSIIVKQCYEWPFLCVFVLT